MEHYILIKIFISSLQNLEGKIIPKFDNHNILTSIKDGINNKRLKTFISKHAKENIILKSRMDKEKIKIDTKNYKTIVDHILNGEKHENESINEWIIDNSDTILKEFNDINYIDFDKEFDKNPYIFIKHMLYIDQGLEKLDSRK